jgi:CSLREA domain-containing protein
MKTHPTNHIWTVILVAALAFAAPLSTRAQTQPTIYVKGMQDDVLTNGNCTLREAILAANSDTPVDACQAGSGADTIYLPAGVYALQIVGEEENEGLSGDLDITAPLTLIGTGAGATIQGYGDTFDPRDRDRSLQIHPGAGQVTLRKISIAGSRASEYGGHVDGMGIHNAADLTLEDCSILDNGDDEYTGVSGGGIHNTGSLHILRCLFAGNFASRGGGLYTSGPTTIKESTFRNNTSDDDNYGGAIYSTGQIEIHGSTFNGNTSSAAGAIYNDGNLLLSDSHLDNNTARFTAAALDNHGTAEVHNITASNNSVGHYVGAIRSTGTLTMTHSIVSGNHSYDYAGAIAQEGGWMYLEDVEIANNSSGGNGGGLYLAGESTRIVNARIHDNASDSNQGGGVYLYNTTTFVDSSITNNFASADGGGIYSDHSVLVLERTVISGNRAGTPDVWAETKNGGGIYQHYGMMWLFDSQVISNQAIENGGGINNDNGSLEMYSTIVNENLADLDGGGMYTYGATYALAGTTFSNNYAQDDGGGIYNSGELHMKASNVMGNWGWGEVNWNIGGGGIANTGVLDMELVTVRNNWTIWTGGGIANTGTLSIINSTVRDNVARDWAGGIWQGGGSLGITNSTLAGNRGDAGGGGLGLEGGSANLNFVTLSGNMVALGWQSAAGGGLQARGGELTIHNTILAGNLDYSGGSAGTLDCQVGPLAIFTNLGYNLVGITDGCNWIGSPGDRTGMLAAPLDPRLLPVRELRWGTPGMPPMHASPVIDAADPTSSEWHDQRQVDRPQGAAKDIGAIEAVSIQAAIDIRPGIPRNLIDCTSPYRVAVAILSHAYFAPAERVDRATITFGHSGFEQSLYYLNGKQICSAADLNGDRQMDLVCEFVISQTGFQCGDTLGHLKAYGTDGELIAGQDAVLITPCR